MPASDANALIERLDGFAKLSSAITQGGFSKVRKATETPFNMILEARP